MLPPQLICIIHLKRKVPQLLRNIAAVLCFRSEIVTSGASTSDVLDHARREGIAHLTAPVRVLFDEHVAETIRVVRVVPIHELLGLLTRPDETLGAAAVVVHLVDTLRVRQRCDFSCGKVKDDEEWNAYAAEYCNSEVCEFAFDICEVRPKPEKRCCYRCDE